MKKLIQVWLSLPRSKRNTRLVVGLLPLLVCGFQGCAPVKAGSHAHGSHADAKTIASSFRP